MLRLRIRIKNLVLDRLRDQVLFQPSWREKTCRQEFFYNAFKALAFNGIDGDYAEFGCWGGMTFALAYHESRRHQHQAKLWAFDSFAGLPAGTVLHVTAWHNNTSGNRFNPDPSQHVTFGQRTVDDMSFAWMKFLYLTDEEYKQQVAERKTGAAKKQQQQQQ
jgi:hypothetical protein